MEIYKTGNIIVRTFKPEDEERVLSIVNDEDFGCIGEFEEYRPDIYQTDLLLYDEKSGNQGIIIEENGDFKGYAIVSKETPKSYLIKQLAVKKEERNKGYGTLLVNVIKASAYADDCKIQTMAYSTEAIDFYIKNGIYNNKTKESSISQDTPGIFDNTQTNHTK